MRPNASVVIAAAMVSIELGCVPPAAGAAQISTLVAQGDILSDPSRPVTAISSIEHVAIGNGGDWVVIAKMTQDGVNVTSANDWIVLKNGLIILQEGDELPGLPFGYVVRESSTTVADLDGQGNIGWALSLVDTFNNTVESGLFWNLDKLFLGDDLSGIPSRAGIPGVFADYKTFAHVKVNENRQMLVRCSIDDIDIGFGLESALVLVSLDASGAVIGEQALAIVDTDDTVAAYPGVVLESIQAGDYKTAFNDAGQYIFEGNFGPDISTDEAVVFNGTTVMARAGAASPVAGRNFGSLNVGGATVDLNNSGDRVLLAKLDSTSTDNDAVFVNGALASVGGVDLIEGTALPFFGGRILEHFRGTDTASTSIQINDAGQLLWHADVDGDTNTDNALLLDDRIVAQQNVTMIGGQLLRDIDDSNSNGWRMSANGQYAIFIGSQTSFGVPNVPGTRQSAFLVEFTACPCDIDGVEGVNVFDLLAYLSLWFASDGAADIDGQAGVDVFDLLAYLECWFPASAGNCS